MEDYQPTDEEKEQIQMRLDQYLEVQSWTDDEWLQVLEAFPPNADVQFGIDYVRNLRNGQRASGINDL